MREVRAFLISLALSVAPASVAAADVPASGAVAENADEMIDRYYRDFYAQRYGDALADIKDLTGDSSNPTGEAVIDAMRASALLGLKRDPEARPLIAEMNSLSPTDPAAQSVLFQGALITDRFDVAADSIDALIARSPDGARDLDWDLIRYFFAHEPKDQSKRNDDRRVALARIGYGGETALGHWRAVEAVNILVRRGDSEGASQLLKYVKEPEAFENMLVQKRYSALWPKLEELAGAHLSQVRADALDSAQRAYLATPDDMEKLHDYVDALRHAGRFDEAIALRSKLPSTAKAMATADEKTGWVVDSIANALYEAGGREDGDRLYAELNDPARTDAPWRVSMIINRLETLTWSGRFEKAASLLDVTEQSADKDGNAYAQQLVRRLRYCILSSTGRKDEATKVLPDMLKHADDAPQPTIEGLLCAGQIDLAEQLAKQQLNNPNQAKREAFEERFVRALQPVPLINDDPSVWANSWKALRNRPAIAAAYEELGRDLPAGLLPQNPTRARAK